ncbi:MAG: type II secretion system F family protein [Polynucleobacter sp.]|nr:MAG: type II secretion system F family protein [Polynucleobacter sp.]
MTEAEQLNVTRQLASLIRSGLPLLDAIRLMEFKTIEKHLHQGRSLSSALEKMGFHAFCVGLIKTGEASGHLYESLAQINIFLDKKIKLNKKIKKALHYPMIVLGISLIVLFAMFHWVIPSFEQMFQNFQAKLPWPTVVLIESSKWLREYFLIIFIGLVFTSLAFIQYWKFSTSLQQLIDRYLLRLPVLGKIRRSVLVTQWARNIGTLYSHGIPILDAIRHTALTSNDWVVYDLCSKTKVLLSQGWSFSDALIRWNTSYQLLHKEYLQLIRISESSGDLGGTLLLVADQEEERLDLLVDQLTQSLEPLLMLIMGGMIGSLVIALYLPIFEMGQIL